MEQHRKKYEVPEFEDENFVSECLELFDEQVTKIEAEYAADSKSA